MTNIALPAFVLRHPRTHMLLADNPNANLRFHSNVNRYRWVRDLSEARRFVSYSDAELPTIFLGLEDFEVRPVLSCGLMGDPIGREEAIATGVFHKQRPATGGGQ